MDEKREYGYARVSSADQNLARQHEAFAKLGIPPERIICDKKSGKDFDRAGYIYLKTNLLRPGDTLVIKSLDRLSRSKEDIKNELEWFKQNKIRLKIIDLPTTMVELDDGNNWIVDMVNNILIEVLSSFAEQERRTIKQRQREGIDAAQKNGVKFGRPRIEYDKKTLDDLIIKWQDKEISVNDICSEMNISQASFYRLLKKSREKKQ